MEYTNTSYAYPNHMMMMQTNETNHNEYLSTLTAYRNSFDQGYSNKSIYTEHQGYSYSEPNCYTPSYHSVDNVSADDASSDSGVPSDNMEDYSDISPVNGNDNQGYYQEYKDWHSVKPLSAWKLKQLRLTPAGIKKRRKDANARERKRMNGLNEAFERLRDAVPGMEEKGEKNKKLSKMDTLQMANLYIRHLASLLNSQEDQK